MKLVKIVGSAVQALGRAISGTLRNLDATAVGWGSGAGLGGRQQNTRAWLEAVESASRIRSAVDRYGKDIAGVKWKLMRRGRQPQQVLEHPILEWMRQPWRSLGGGSWWSFAWLTEAWLQSDANCFWYMPWTPAECNAKGIPFECWPIPPHWVQSLPRANFPMYGLVMPWEEIPEWIPARKMVWMRKPSLLNPFGRGRAAIHAIDDEVVFGEAANKYLNSFFRNSARPDIIMFAEGAQPQDVDRIEQNFEARHRGFLKAFRPAVIPGKGSFHQVSPSFADMTLVSLLRYNRDQQWQVFGLSPDIMGAVENSNRASIEAAAYHHQLFNLKPEVTFLECELNLWVVPMWGEPDLYLEAEEVVQETAEYKLQKAKEGWASGLVERNEARHILGHDPMEDARGRMVGQPVATIQIGPDGKAQPWPSAPGGDGKVGQPVKKSARWATNFKLLRLALETGEALLLEFQNADVSARETISLKRSALRAMIDGLLEQLDQDNQEDS